MSLQFWLAFAAYLLPTFPLGYFWHLRAFKTRYDALEMLRDDVFIPMGLGSMVLQGLLFAWAYPLLFAPTEWFWSTGALGFFVFAGLLSWSFQVLPVAAKYRMASVPAFVALESAFVALHFAVVSPLIALAYAM
ncbi:MAG: hypothetical protein KF849_13145 [Rhizobiaceae bacterium]|nr:hypothetical protein [Rhizobiaceae bacterium]